MKKQLFFITLLNVFVGVAIAAEKNTPDEAVVKAMGLINQKLDKSYFKHYSSEKVDRIEKLETSGTGIQQKVNLMLDAKDYIATEKGSVDEGTFMNSIENNVLFQELNIPEQKKFISILDLAKG